MDIHMFCIFGIVVLPLGKRRWKKCQLCNVAYLALWYYPWENADGTNANYATIMDVGMFCIFGIVVLPLCYLSRQCHLCKLCNANCAYNAIYAIHTMPIVHTLPFMQFTQCQLRNPTHVIWADNANCAYNAIYAMHTMPIVYTMPFVQPPLCY